MSFYLLASHPLGIVCFTGADGMPGRDGNPGRDGYNGGRGPVGEMGPRGFDGKRLNPINLMSTSIRRVDDGATC